VPAEKGWLSSGESTNAEHDEARKNQMPVCQFRDIGAM
jgi:hypothetical protein